MSLPDTGRITTERQGRILVITFDRPAKYNGFTPTMFDELTAAYNLLDRDPELWVGVVYGEAARVDGLVERVFDQLGYEARVVATGGLAHRIAPASKHIAEINLELV